MTPAFFGISCATLFILRAKRVPANMLPWGTSLICVFTSDVVSYSHLKFPVFQKLSYIYSGKYPLSPALCMSCKCHVSRSYRRPSLNQRKPETCGPLCKTLPHLALQSHQMLQATPIPATVTLYIGIYVDHF